MYVILNILERDMEHKKLMKTIDKLLIIDWEKSLEK